MAVITTIMETTVETILTMYLFGSLWDRCTMAFKVTTAMLHFLFMSCQFWGSYNFYKMYQRQKNLIAKNEGKEGEVEQQPGPTKSEAEDRSNLSVIGREIFYTLHRGNHRESDCNVARRPGWFVLPSRGI
jgi:hypothetical protein